MGTTGVGARTHLFGLTNKELGDLIALPDEDAARELQCRLAGIEKVEELHERSYSEIMIIADQFERRKLWQCIDNPVSGVPFNSWSAWATAAAPRCRRVMMEARSDAKALADIPPASLVGVSKSNVQVLKKLSTKVRNEPQILEAAKTLPQDEFIAKIEKEKPDQHIGGMDWLRAHMERAAIAQVKEVVEYAIQSGRAANLGEAIERGMLVARDAWIEEDLHPNTEAEAQQQRVM
jgi:hypothetical protein